MNRTTNRIPVAGSAVPKYVDAECIMDFHGSDNAPADIALDPLIMARGQKIELLGTSAEDSKILIGRYNGQTGWFPSSLVRVGVVRSNSYEDYTSTDSSQNDLSGQDSSYAPSTDPTEASSSHQSSVVAVNTKVAGPTVGEAAGDELGPYSENTNLMIHSQESRNSCVIKSDSESIFSANSAESFSNAPNRKQRSSNETQATFDLVTGMMAEEKESGTLSPLSPPARGMLTRELSRASRQPSLSQAALPLHGWSLAAQARKNSQISIGSSNSQSSTHPEPSSLLSLDESLPVIKESISFKEEVKVADYPAAWIPVKTKDDLIHVDPVRGIVAHKVTKQALEQSVPLLSSTQGLREHISNLHAVPLDKISESAAEGASHSLAEKADAQQSQATQKTGNTIWSEITKELEVVDLESWYEIKSRVDETIYNLKQKNSRENLHEFATSIFSVAVAVGIPPGTFPSLAYDELSSEYRLMINTVLLVHLELDDPGRLLKILNKMQLHVSRFLMLYHATQAKANEHNSQTPNPTGQIQHAVKFNVFLFTDKWESRLLDSRGHRIMKPKMDDAEDVDPAQTLFEDDGEENGSLLDFERYTMHKYPPEDNEISHRRSSSMHTRSSQDSPLSPGAYINSTEDVTSSSSSTESIKQPLELESFEPLDLADENTIRHLKAKRNLLVNSSNCCISLFHNRLSEHSVSGPLTMPVNSSDVMRASGRGSVHSAHQSLQSLDSEDDNSDASEDEFKPIEVAADFEQTIADAKLMQAPVKGKPAGGHQQFPNVVHRDSDGSMSDNSVMVFFASLHSVLAIFKTIVTLIDSINIKPFWFKSCNEDPALRDLGVTALLRKYLGSRDEIYCALCSLESHLSQNSNARSLSAKYGQAIDLLPVITAAVDNLIEEAEALRESRSLLATPKVKPIEVDVIFSSEGRLLGGTKKGLLQQITSHDRRNADIAQTILLTFPAYMTELEMLKIMIQRYNLEYPHGLDEEQSSDWERRVRFPVRLRTVNVLKQWFLDHWVNMVTLKGADIEEFWETAMEFVEDLQSQKFAGAKGLADAFWARKNGECVKTVRAISQPTPDVIAPLPHEPGQLSIEHIDPRELARQLSILGHKSYCLIRTQDLLARYIRKLKATSTSIKDYVSLWNTEASWVSATILDSEDVNVRAKALMYYIDVATECMDVHNFSSSMAILSALHSANIYRLKKTWDLVSREHMKDLRKIEKVMSSQRNFRTYRDQLSLTSGPGLPFFGICLMDLQYACDGNADTLNDSRIINLGKWVAVSHIITETLRLQKLQLNLDVEPEITQFLTEQMKKAAPLNDQYNLSLQREPRIRPRSQGHKPTSSTGAAIVEAVASA